MPSRWVRQRVERVRKILVQVGLEPERLQAFVSNTTSENPAKTMDNFIEQVHGLYLASVMMKEVKS